MLLTKRTKNQLFRITTGLMLAGALSLTACSKTNFQSLNVPSSGGAPGIVNGTTATNANVQPEGLANSVVAIFVALNGPTGKGALCTGTLISTKVVLTAGHCVEGAKANTKIYVSFQTLNIKNSNKSNTILAKSFAIHPNYADAQANKTTNQVDDLALILLSNPAPSSVSPASLAPADFNLSSLDAFTDVGFGQADDRHNSTNDGAGTLRYLEYSSQKVENYSGNNFLNGMIIADGQSASTCHGDSGGPLFAGNVNSTGKVIVGVVDLGLPIYSGQQETDYETAAKSGSIDGFYKKYPDAHICLGYDVFVNVSSHLDWINQTKAQLESE